MAVPPTSSFVPQALASGAQLAAGLSSGLAAGGQQLGAGIGAGIAGLSWAGRKHRELLKGDVAKMEAGKLGWTEAQKRQYLGASLRAAQAAAAPMLAAMEQQRAAQGFGRSGAATDQIGAAQGAIQSGVAQAVGGGEALSQQQALTKEADIKARVAAQRDKVSGDWGNVMGGVAGAAGALAGMGFGAKVIPKLMGSIATKAA